MFWLKQPYQVIKDTKDVLGFIAASIEEGEKYKSFLRQNAGEPEMPGIVVPQAELPTGQQTYNSLRWSKVAKDMLSARRISAATLGLSGLIRTRDIPKQPGPEITGNKAPTTYSKKAQMLPRKPGKSKKAEIQFLKSANADAILSQVSVLVPTNHLFKKAANDPELAKQFSARIIFEVSRLLRKYPDLQSVYEDDILFQCMETNIGYALCIDRGLKVPVFRDCDKLDLDTIIEQKDAFIEKYVSNSLSPEDLEGGTFTITDLSSTGAWLFNPVLNYRQSCILGIGGENPEGNTWPLILAFDHRVTDGMTASAFLNDLKQRLCSHESLLNYNEGDSTQKDKQKTDDPAGRQEPENNERELPFCSKCYRDIDELNAMDHYLVQTINHDGDVQLVCTICMEGW
jgi:hypothetical protein